MDRELISRCNRVSTSTWSDALDQLGLNGVLHGLVTRAGSGRFAGPAVTVAEWIGPLGSAQASEFGIDIVLRGARAGDVLVIAQSGEPPASAIGGLAALASRRHGVAGIVVAGACRDVEELADIGLPVMSRSLTPASGRGRARVEGINVPIAIDGVTVSAGDIVVGDETGVVVVPRGQLEELLALAERRAQDDARRAAALAPHPVGQVRR
jgi:3-hexulose-6-phosphate synthase / 6-phospho-3-hexuloisomerase